MRTLAISFALGLMLIYSYASGQTILDTVFTPPGYVDGTIRGTVYMPTYPNGTGVVLVPGTVGTDGRGSLASWARALAGYGYTAIAINYSPAGCNNLDIYPRPVRAVKTAVQFLRRHAARFNLATGRVAGFGFSAGSIFWGESMPWDNDHRFFHTDSAISDRLDAAVLFYGLYNTMDHLERGDGLDGNAMLQQYFGNDSTVRATKGNCIANVDKISTPLLLFHGTNDIRVHFHQSVELSDSLLAHGKIGQLVLFQGGEHGFDVIWGSFTLTPAGIIARDTALAFLQRTVVRDAAYVTGLSARATTMKPRHDSATVRVTVQNPEHHALAITAFMTDTLNGIRDSLALYNDGLHNDESANDNVWGGAYGPSKEGVIGVGLRTQDLSAGTQMICGGLTYIATAGPLASGTYQFTEGSTDTLMAPGKLVYVRIGLKHMGTSGAITNVRGQITSVSAEDVANPAFLNWPTLLPGQTIFSSDATALYFDVGRSPGATVSFALKISSNGVWFWQDTLRMVLTGVKETSNMLPTQYALEQNYPNPFNPSTTIHYALPQKSHVRMTVYNTLGQRVAELLNGEIEAGYHAIRFNADMLASGVYFYRLQAGEFLDTKRFLLIK